MRATTLPSAAATASSRLALKCLPSPAMASPCFGHRPYLCSADKKWQYKHSKVHGLSHAQQDERRSELLCFLCCLELELHELLSSVAIIHTH